MTPPPEWRPSGGKPGRSGVLGYCTGCGTKLYDWLFAGHRCEPSPNLPGECQIAMRAHGAPV